MNTIDDYIAALQTATFEDVERLAAEYTAARERAANPEPSLLDDPILVSVCLS